jgi:methyltransferase (TIGR00027 family)
MSDASIEHVSDTAYLVAQCRVVETARPDPLFRDPLAKRLAGERGEALLRAFPTAPMTAWMIAIRTVIIDELVQSALQRGVDMVVNLGAGLDTRPYRIELPKELLWIEADYPHVVAFKSEQLANETPRCRLERVGVDLANFDARRELLRNVSAQARRPLILTEGLVPYLTLEQASALARDLLEVRGVDGWIVDYVAPESHEYRHRRGLTKHMRAAPFAFKPPDWFAFFESVGWRAREARYLPEVGAALGRRAPLPWRMRLMTRLLGTFAPPKRRNAFRRFAGYVVLEPAQASS